MSSLRAKIILALVVGIFMGLAMPHIMPMIGEINTLACNICK